MASSLLDAALVASGGVLGIFSYSFASAWLRRGAPFVFTVSQKIDESFIVKTASRSTFQLKSDGTLLIWAAAPARSFERQ